MHTPFWVKNRILRAFPRSLRPRRRIALVGSGPIDPKAAAEIDDHDLVIRFNGCANYGATGRRIDVLVLSNSGGGGKHLANSPEAINLAAWAAAKEFWLRALSSSCSPTWRPATRTTPTSGGTSPRTR